MPELLRPEPPRSLLDRLSRLRTLVDPARAAVAAGMVALVVVAGWWLVRPTPRPVEADLPVASTAPLASPPSVVPAEIVVQVAGAVVHPDVYRLASACRSRARARSCHRASWVRRRLARAGQGQEPDRPRRRQST